MRIAFLQLYSSQPTPDYRKLASELRSRGHTVWVGTPNESGDLVWCGGDDVVFVQRGPARVPDRLSRLPLAAPVWRRVLFLGFMLRLRRFLWKEQPDIVHVNPASVLWLSLLPLFKPRQMRFVIDFRQVGQLGSTDWIGKLRGCLANWQRQACSKFIYDRACFLHPAGAKVTLGEDWHRWGSVVPMGVDPLFLTFERGDLSVRSNGYSVRFLYVGRLSKVRRLERILFAAERMLAVTNEFEVVFIGPDAAGGFYQNLVNELKLDSVVAIERPVPYEDVPKVASGCDVALAYVPNRPADWQYHPTLKVLEYRALGMPILASDNQPNREIVQDGVNGLLVTNSAESLAQAMLRFVRDPRFLAACDRNAQTMRQGTIWSEVAKMYEEEVYQELLRGR